MPKLLCNELHEFYELNKFKETERQEADRFMLRKAQAVALLRWRGHQIPPN